MRTWLLFSLLTFASGHALAEPSFGQLVGVEDDFLTYRCSEQSSGKWECNFTQTSMSLKVKPENLEQEVAKRVATAADQLNGSDELDEFCPVVVPMMKASIEAMRLIASGNDEAATAILEKLPAEALSEFDVDEFRRQAANSDPREIDDISKQTETFVSLCEERSIDALEAMIRLEVQKEARTCKLFVNEWSDTFEKVSDTRWVISNGGPRGECGIVRLDRFECQDRFLCDFVSEKRVLNAEAEPISGIPCSGLEEDEFRYSYDGDGVYLQCEIMSQF